VSPADVDGHVDARFAAVRDAFCENFASHDELGAAVCVVVEGRTVVDLWGGHRDLARTRAWEPDTLVDVFSVGKGLLAAGVARLVSAGALAYDEPVARRWPSFAAAGKEGVTLRDLLSHRAGLPAVRARLPAGAMLSEATMRDALATQAPWWPPGTALGYHVNTFGFLVGAVVEAAAGMPVAAYLRKAVCDPIGADLCVGVAREDLGRVAEFRWPQAPPPEREPDLDDDLELMRFNAYFNPSGLSGCGVVNTEAWRTASHPSSNAHGTARGVARLYEALAAGGRLGAYDLVEPAVLSEATREAASGDDLVLERPSRFGLGFQLTMPARPIGLGARGFGHFGAGGSLGCCDPECGLALGYVTSDMGPRWQNPRNRGLTEAVRASIEG